MSEKKTVFQFPEWKGDQNLIRFGNDQIELEDQSSAVFETDDVESFVKFLKKQADMGNKELELYYSAEQVVLWPTEDPTPLLNRRPLGLLVLSTHPLLETLFELVRRSFNIGLLEQKLKRLKRHMGSEGIDILDRLGDFQVRKVTNIKRSRDHAGNMSFGIERKSGGGDDFIPPKEVFFRVPLFEGVDGSEAFIQIKLDFLFDYEVEDESVEFKFKFENPTFDIDLLEQRKKCLSEVMAGIDYESFWGKVEIHKATDEWKYKDNGISNH